MNKIAIFASGGGTNAENIISYFKDKTEVAKIAFVVTNNAQAGVINRCKRLAIPVFIVNNASFDHPMALLNFLQKNNINWIILAGFLRKINPILIDNFLISLPYRRINIVAFHQLLEQLVISSKFHQNLCNTCNLYKYLTK